MAETANPPNSEGNTTKPSEPIDWEAKYREETECSHGLEARLRENENAAEELVALKESKLTETEKLTARAERAEKALAGIKVAQEQLEWKNAASKKNGVPVDLLRGATKEEIDAHANALKTYIDTTAKPRAAKVADPAGTPANDGTNPNVGLLRQLFGKNEQGESMVLQTTQVTLPNDVSLAVVGKAHGTSTIASLCPADKLGFLDDKYNVFTGKARAQVVAEGEKKAGYEQPITPKEGKRFTVQCTTRVSKQLQWADEDNQLQILDAIQSDQAAALGEALDYVVYHAVNPASGGKLTGYEALGSTATAVTAGTDQLANLDTLTDKLLKVSINGIALSRTMANELRKLRVSNTGGRLFPETAVAERGLAGRHPPHPHRPRWRASMRPRPPRHWCSSVISARSNGVWCARSPPR